MTIFSWIYMRIWGAIRWLEEIDRIDYQRKGKNYIEVAM